MQHQREPCVCTTPSRHVAWSRPLDIFIVYFSSTLIGVQPYTLKYGSWVKHGQTVTATDPLSHWPWSVGSDQYPKHNRCSPHAITAISIQANSLALSSKHCPFEHALLSKLSLTAISSNTIPYMEQGHVALPDFAHVSTVRCGSQPSHWLRC